MTLGPSREDDGLVRGDRRRLRWHHPDTLSPRRSFDRINRRRPVVSQFVGPENRRQRNSYKSEMILLLSLNCRLDEPDDGDGAPVRSQPNHATDAFPPESLLIINGSNLVIRI